ncbi:MAG: winged helix-turn-helix transcriptional regulator [Candidatus Lokiarchaeota archaeon]|nr:winged helix-turn-helix transcriptional regulator [Candidatus Lokiarchaeota archaeon]
MISEKIGIDSIDCQIMELIQKSPNLTHTEIATHVNRSQPTVGMRIKKLEKLGVLKYQAGINIKVADLCFARVELQTKNPKKAIEIVKRCPSMINALRISGSSNLSIFMVGIDFKVLDNIVNINFRNNPDVFNVHMDIIEDVVNDFVLPIDLNLDNNQLTLTKDCCCCGQCTCHLNLI